MSVHIPEAAQALLELVVGSDWPDGDEDALRALSTVWSDAATELESIQHTASSLAASVGQVAKGAAADAFAAYWSKNIDDGSTSVGKGSSPPILPFSVSFCQQMAKACDDGALEIETAKEMVVGQLLLLAAELAGTDILGMFTFGLADLGDIAEVAATRLVCKEIINEAVTKVVTKMLAAAIEMGVTQGVLDLAIQTIQVAEHRRSFSGMELLESVGSGALAGALGAGFGLGVGALGRVGAQEGANALGRAAETKLGTVATAVAGGGFTNAAMDLAENHKVSLSDLTNGSLGGAIGAAHGVHAETHLPDSVSEPEMSAAGSAVAADGASTGSLHTVLAGLDTHYDADGSVHQDTSDAAGATSGPVAQVTVPDNVRAATDLSGIDDTVSGLSSPDEIAPGGRSGDSGTGPSVTSDSASIEGAGARFTASADTHADTGSVSGGLRAEATDPAAFTADRTPAPTRVASLPEDAARATVGQHSETLTAERSTVPDPRTAEPASSGDPLTEAPREGVTAADPSANSAAETSTPIGIDARPVHDRGAVPEADSHASTGLSGADLADRSTASASGNGADYGAQGDFAPSDSRNDSADRDPAVVATGDDMGAAPQSIADPAGAGRQSGGTSDVVVGSSGRTDAPAARASSADGATRPDPSGAEAQRAASLAPESAIPAPATERPASGGGQRPADPAAPDPRGQNDGDTANTAPVVDAVVVPVDARTVAPSNDAAQVPVAPLGRTDRPGLEQGSTVQSPREPRPDLSTLREVRPGRQGTIDPVDQQRVELRFPRDEQGNPLPFRDPRENLRILASNDGGPLADPFRGNNCADQSCTEMENWFGNPQVSAPRYAEYVDGGPSRAGEDGGIQKIEALTGVKLGYDGPGADGYQHLAERLLDAGHGAAAVVVVDWGNGSSHAFNAFNHEGTILWTDGQGGLVSESTPLWPQAKEVWSAGVDADRNPLPGYDPLDTSLARPEAEQNAPTPETREQEQTPQTQQSEAGTRDGAISGTDDRNPQQRDGRPPAEERSPAHSLPADPGALPAHDRDHTWINQEHSDVTHNVPGGKGIGADGYRNNADLPEDIRLTPEKVATILKSPAEELDTASKRRMKVDFEQHLAQRDEHGNIVRDGNGDAVPLPQDELDAKLKQLREEGELSVGKTGGPISNGKFAGQVVKFSADWAKQAEANGYGYDPAAYSGGVYYDLRGYPDLTPYAHCLVDLGPEPKSVPGQDADPLDPVAWDRDATPQMKKVAAKAIAVTAKKLDRELTPQEEQAIRARTQAKMVAETIRNDDFRRANNAMRAAYGDQSGTLWEKPVGNAPKGWTWHHLPTNPGEPRKMILVPRAAHEGARHYGGIATKTRTPSLIDPTPTLDYQHHVPGARAEVPSGHSQNPAVAFNPNPVGLSDSKGVYPTNIVTVPSDPVGELLPWEDYLTRREADHGDH